MTTTGGFIGYKEIIFAHDRLQVEIPENVQESLLSSSSTASTLPLLLCCSTHLPRCR